MEVNKLYNENNLETMARMPDCFIDLTVTSPPYDGLRTYNGYSFPFEDIAKELYRATKLGGVVVWVVGDSTVNGSESGTSFRQALYFMQCGFLLHDTMIYRKLNPTPNSGNRYQQSFEYMFVFSKGAPKSANILTTERRNKCNDKRTYRKKSFVRDKDGNFDDKSDYFIKEIVPKENIFEYYVGGGNSTNDEIAFKHPAIYPEKLCADHIYSWSNEGDLVYDCFGGSGTTAKMAHIQKRKWILSEISKEYCEIANKRLAPYLTQYVLAV